MQLQKLSKISIWNQKSQVAPWSDPLAKLFPFVLNWIMLKKNPRSGWTCEWKFKNTSIIKDVWRNATVCLHWTSIRKPMRRAFRRRFSYFSFQDDVCAGDDLNSSRSTKCIKGENIQQQNVKQHRDIPQVKSSSCFVNILSDNFWVFFNSEKSFTV